MTATTDHAIRHAIPKLLAIADALAPEGHGTAGEYGDCPGCDLRAVVADLRDALDGETPSEAPDAGSGPSPEGRSGRNSGVSAQARAGYTVAEIAEMLHISRPTVYKLLNSGELESFTIGRARRISPECLASYIDARLAAEA